MIASITTVGTINYLYSGHFYTIVTATINNDLNSSTIVIVISGHKICITLRVENLFLRSGPACDRRPSICIQHLAEP